MPTRAAPPPVSVRSFPRFFVRQLAVEPLRAAAAFDDWRQGCDVVIAPAGRLTLGPALNAFTRVGAHPDDAWRAVRARLHPSRWIAGVSVELAVVPWSDDVTEVDLRPTGRGDRFLGMPASIYFAAGRSVLDLVLAELLARTSSCTERT